MGIKLTGYAHHTSHSTSRARERRRPVLGGGGGGWGFPLQTCVLADRGILGKRMLGVAESRGAVAGGAGCRWVKESGAWLSEKTPLVPSSLETPESLEKGGA